MRNGVVRSILAVVGSCHVVLQKDGDAVKWPTRLRGKSLEIKSFCLFDRLWIDLKDCTKHGSFQVDLFNAGDVGLEQ